MHPLVLASPSTFCIASLFTSRSANSRFLWISRLLGTDDNSAGDFKAGHRQTLLMHLDALSATFVFQQHVLNSPSFRLDNASQQLLHLQQVGAEFRPF